MPAGESGLPNPGADPIRRLVWAEGMLKAVHNDPLAFLSMDENELRIARYSLRESINTATNLLDHIGEGK